MLRRGRARLSAKYCWLRVSPKRTVGNEKDPRSGVAQVVRIHDGRSAKTGAVLRPDSLIATRTGYDFGKGSGSQRALGRQAGARGEDLAERSQRPARAGRANGRLQDAVACMSVKEYRAMDAESASK